MSQVYSGTENPEAYSANLLVSGGRGYYVMSGGVAYDFTVTSGSVISADEGGTLISTNISSGGFTIAQRTPFDVAEPAGVISASKIYNGGIQEINSGTADATTIFNGGEQIVYYGSASGTIVSGGGAEAVGGLKFISGAYANTSGVDSSTIVESGSLELVGTGSIADATQIQSGGIEELNGGSANSPVIQTGGLLIDFGGVISGVNVQSGGTILFVDGTLAGGQAINNISSGAVFEIGGSVSASRIVYYNLSGNYGGALSGISFGHPGAIELVNLNGTVTSGGVVSGAIQEIASGGTAITDYVGNATLDVLSGGYVEGFTVSAGTAYVSGSAVDGVVSGNVTAADFPLAAPYADFSLLTVASGGYTSGVDVLSGGLQIISSGGTSISGLAQDGDIVVAGGTISGTVVDATSDIPAFIVPAISVTQSGAAISSLISSGGLESLNSGGTSLFTTAFAGGLEKAFAGGTSLSATIGSGANSFIIGGTAIDMTIKSGGLSLISGGGQSISGTVLDGGQLDIWSGGLVSATQIVGSGVEFVFAGGQSISGTVLGGGQLVILSGGADSGAQIASGGIEVVSSGGTASGSVLSSGGYQQVEDGTVVSTVVSGDASIQVLLGIARASHILSGGALIIASGATLFTNTVSSLVSSGGAEQVNGGFASGTIIGDGGQQTVNGPLAYAIDTVISAGGAQFVYNGFDTSGTLLSGAQQVVSGADASVNADKISSGGVVYVDQGAANYEILSGGTLFVSNGGSADKPTVLGGGTETVYIGGTSISAIVRSGAITVSAGGQALAPNIFFGGRVTINAGGTASGAFISAGGLYVSAGGTAIKSTINADESPMQGHQFVFGDSISSLVESDGIEIVGAGGVSISAQVLGQNDATALTHEVFETAGQLVVQAGGRASNTIVEFGGILYVSSGGQAIDPIVQAGGRIADGGGTIINPTIEGLETDGNADPVSGALVESGGLFIVTPGGSASATTVANGGTLVEAGGAVTGVQSAGGTVISSGVVTVADGSVISTSLSTISLTISGGQTVYVLSGGTAIAAQIDGGTLELTGGSATGGMVFGAGAGLLNIDASPPITSISGFSTGDVIDLTSLQSVSGGFASLSGSVLTIIEGANSATLKFSSDVTGDVFSAYADAAGLGTDVSIACYAAGTLILTPGGPARVEHLRPGDRVITVLPGEPAYQTIVWTGHRHIDLLRHADPDSVRPVIIRAGALGPGVPERDLRVSPHHGLYLEGALYEAVGLINGTSILRDERTRAVTYHHIELDSHSLIIAEGCASETYIDTGNRGMFAESSGHVWLHPVFQTAQNAPTCAPIIRPGPKATAMRARLEINVVNEIKVYLSHESARAE